MDKYRKRPVVIEAMEWDGNIVSLTKVMLDANISTIEQDFLSGDVIIPTLEGNMCLRKGDWLVKGTQGELYPCKPDIFKEIYEKV